MRSYPSNSSCPNSLSSSSSLNRRLETIFKKADELSILCDIEMCVIHYSRDGELTIWPEEREKVENLALRYIQLPEAVRRKKRLDLHGFLNKIKNKPNFKKKAKTKDLYSKKRKTSFRNVNHLKYPISDHYCPDQISQLTQSLELNVSNFQERLRFLESRKQKETTKLNQQSSTPISLDHHQNQTQFLNPNNFSLLVYNHGDATLSQIPLSASNLNQDFSAFLRDSGLQNQMMQKELYGCDPNTYSMDNINFQHPCVSNTDDYSGLLAVQESVNNQGLNYQMMQHELYGGYGQNMWASDITNRNALGTCLSNTISDKFCYDFQNLYGNMVVNSSPSQDLSDFYSSYGVTFDESSLFQTSTTLPSLSTVPNSYLLSDSSRFF